MRYWVYLLLLDVLGYNEYNNWLYKVTQTIHFVQYKTYGIKYSYIGYQYNRNVMLNHMTFSSL